MRTAIIFLTVISFMLFTGGCSKKVAIEPEPVQETVTPPPVQKPVEIQKTPVTETTTAVTSEQNQTTETAKTAKVVYNWRDVNFDYDSYELRPVALKILAEHARYLKDNPSIKVLIEGHCDERGTIEYNLALGERRSNSVKKYLVNYGIKTERLSTVSYGKERPMNPAHTVDAWAKNRRAALVTG